MADDKIIGYQIEGGVLCARCAPEDARELPLAAADLDTAAALGAIVCAGPCGDPWTGGSWRGLGSGLVELDVADVRSPLEEARRVRNVILTRSLAPGEKIVAFRTDEGAYTCLPCWSSGSSKPMAEPVAAGRLAPRTTCGQCAYVWVEGFWFPGSGLGRVGTARWIDDVPADNEAPVRYQDLGFTAAEAERVVAYRTDAGLVCSVCASLEPMHQTSPGVTLADYLTIAASRRPCIQCGRGDRDVAGWIQEMFRWEEAERRPRAGAPGASLASEPSEPAEHTYFKVSLPFDRASIEGPARFIAPGALLEEADGSRYRVTAVEGDAVYAEPIEDTPLRLDPVFRREEYSVAPARRVARLRFSVESFRTVFAPGPHPSGYEVVGTGLPADAKIVDARFEYPNAVVCVVESDSYEPVPDGAPIPERVVVVRRLETRVEPFATGWPSWDTLRDSELAHMFDAARRLDIKDGSVVVFTTRRGLDLDQRRTFFEAVQAVTGLERGRVGLIYLSPDESIDALDEDRMRELGWVRAEE